MRYKKLLNEDQKIHNLLDLLLRSFQDCDNEEKILRMIESDFEFFYIAFTRKENLAPFFCYLKIPFRKAKINRFLRNG